VATSAWSHLRKVIVTAQQTPLTVRYNPILGWAFLSLGVLNLVLGLWLLALGVPGVSLFLGALFIVLGVIYLRREYFVFVPSAQAVEVVAPIGTRRLYSPDRGGELMMDGGRIVITRATGKNKKVPVSRYMSHRTDWDAVTAAITKGTAAR
jgi:hypothetical protein